MSRCGRLTVGVLLVAIFVAIIGLRYVWVWTELEIVSAAVLSSHYQRDAYLESVILWRNIPTWLTDYLAPLVHVKEFSFYDESGQFRYNNELYGVVTQLNQVNVLDTMPGRDRTVVELLGQSLTEVGVVPVNGSDAGGLIFIYYGVSYTGRNASTEIAGPNTIKLVYSVFGINRTTRWGTDAK